MYEYIIYMRNNEYIVYYKNDRNDLDSKVDYSKLSEVLKDLKENNRIRTCYLSNDDLIVSTLEGKIILKSYKKFSKTDEFKFIFDKISSKKYKTDKSKFKRVVALSLSSALAITGIVAIAKMSSPKVEDNVVTTQVSEEIKYTDNHIEEIEEKTEEENNIDEIINKFNIGSQENSEDVLRTKELYYNKICSICEKYNIDPDVILAIATQEQGVHNPDAEGSAIGLMQIEKVHIGETIVVHNYLTDEDEKYIITEELLRDLDFNIIIGVAIFQNCLDTFNGNYLLAVEAYNKGIYAIQRSLKICSEKEEISVEDLMDNYESTIWYKYIDERGDDEYSSHVWPKVPIEVFKSYVGIDGIVK